MIHSVAYLFFILLLNYVIIYLIRRIQDLLVIHDWISDNPAFMYSIYVLARASCVGHVTISDISASMIAIEKHTFLPHNKLFSFKRNSMILSYILEMTKSYDKTRRTTCC
jgi:hypothetical protein